MCPTQHARHFALVRTEAPAPTPTHPLMSARAPLASMALNASSIADLARWTLAGTTAPAMRYQPTAYVPMAGKALAVKRE